MTTTPKTHGGKRSGAGRPRAPGESLQNARRRKETALADLREIEVRRRRGELLEAAEVGRDWQAMLRQVRAGLLAIPSRLRSKVPTLDARTMQILDAEIRRALTVLGNSESELSDGTNEVG